ncbi:hypothetical protein QJS04_geneDACA000191 [Acorus gramineus]|uniref:Uncharacterized protein n=1 Tax=Acorus gramineus TaxID=55184 RepID=A0AAV9AQJ8_ACOGR|nr:hypothetical protein QJS04_geneDACA000191 [Acorus gramineus]
MYHPIKMKPSSISIARSLSLLRELKLKGCNALTNDGLLPFSFNLLKSSPSGGGSPPLGKLSLASCGFGARGIAFVVSSCGLLRDLSLKRLRKLDAQNVPIEIETMQQHSNHQRKLNNVIGGGNGSRSGRGSAAKRGRSICAQREGGRG